MRGCILLASVAMLAGCLRPQAAPPAVSLPEAGRVAYERACASCHEDGLGGAPRTRRPEDWEGRSNLWQAVLADHARRGYLGMPAKGGDPELSDREVQAAAEYMLTLTHPNMPAG